MTTFEYEFRIYRMGQIEVLRSCFQNAQWCFNSLQRSHMYITCLYYIGRYVYFRITVQMYVFASLYGLFVTVTSYLFFNNQGQMFSNCGAFSWILAYLAQICKFSSFQVDDGIANNEEWKTKSFCIKKAFKISKRKRCRFKI